MINSNEDRADIAERAMNAFFAKGFFTNPKTAKDPEAVEANRADALGDFLSYLAHYAARYDLGPRAMFERALQSYDDDHGDDPAFAQYPPVIRRRGKP